MFITFKFGPIFFLLLVIENIVALYKKHLILKSFRKNYYDNILFFLQAYILIIYYRIVNRHSVQLID